MNRFIKTLKNIWSIEELRSKIITTLLLVLVYRVGTSIPLPGIDPTKLNTNTASSGPLGLIDAFAGGAFSHASIFALGIMPYISASIFMQLMTVLVPRFQKMQKEGALMAEADRQKAEKSLRDEQREFSRKAGEFQDDASQRRNEEIGKVQRYLAQGFSANDLSRVTVVRSKRDAVARVIVFGRLSLFGVGAARLHDAVMQGR